MRDAGQDHERYEHENQNEIRRLLQCAVTAISGVPARAPAKNIAQFRTHVRSELRAHLPWRARRRAVDGGYGTLQKTSYLILIFVFVPLMILTGIAQSPGFTAAMPALLDLFGGRQSARTLHTIGTVALVLFVVVHVIEVAAAGFVARVRSMITGK